MKEQTISFAALLFIIVFAGPACGDTSIQKATSTPSPTSGRPTPAPQLTIAPSPTVAPTATPAAFVVGNTDGEGVYIRRTPSMADKIKAWPDGTVMALVGGDQQAESRQWRNVRDPDGTVGWVPAEYLVSAPKVDAPILAAASAPNLAPEPGKIALPQHSVLNEDVYDAPIKTQVTTSILVSGDVTEQGLRELLNQLFDSTKQRTGFKYHPSPTAIYIYAFTSRERAESDMGLWVAMLAKSHVDTSPSIKVNNPQLAQLGAKPEERFGLSEKKRMEIWSAYYLAEQRAWEDSEQKYPIDPTQSMAAGQSLVLTKRTSLIPDIRPRDPIAGMKQVKWLEPGTRITVLKIDTSEENPWYWVEAVSPIGTTIGQGWVNSIGLMNQAGVDPREQMTKQAQFANTLTQQHRAELASTYGIAVEQLEAIIVEAHQKDWPYPKTR